MSCENHHTHTHGDDDHIPPEQTFAGQLLNAKINLPHVRALNVENTLDDVQKLFKPAAERYSLKPVVKSDADEQLIVQIPFLNGSVKLHLIILRTNGDRFCPKTIRLWKNTDIDFDNVELTKPAFTLTHPHVGVAYNDPDDEMPDVVESDADFVEHHLPRRVFTGVQQLTLFVKDIYGDEDQCHLHLIELRGEYTELSRDPVVTIYELAPNPADHQKVDAAKTAGSFGM